MPTMRPRAHDMVLSGLRTKVWEHLPLAYWSSPMSAQSLVPLTPTDLGKLGTALGVKLQPMYEPNKKNRYYSIEAGPLVLTRQGQWKKTSEQSGRDCLPISKTAAMISFKGWLQKQLQHAQLDNSGEQEDNGDRRAK